VVVAFWTVTLEAALLKLLVFSTFHVDVLVAEFFFLLRRSFSTPFSQVGPLLL